jgi:ADP-heptose:LPS heptosyltransferase
MNKHSIILQHKYALGDTVLMSALVRDLHRAYPGKFEVAVDTHCGPVWDNNPHVARFAQTANIQRVAVKWGKAITDHSLVIVNGRRELKHILAWYHHDFERQTGIHVPVTDPRPDLHLSVAENRPAFPYRYWVIVAGGKTDITNKLWNPRHYQAVVDALRGQGLHFIQCGGVHSEDIHPPLSGVTSALGCGLRDLFRLIRHAEGVICPVTGPMHVAAAFEKPCVVIAGGREEPWFEAYINSDQEAFGKGCRSVKIPHRFLHTIGMLPCCHLQGCWKLRTVAIEPSDLVGDRPHKLCLNPAKTEVGPIAGCMSLILPDHVVKAVLSYYVDGTLQWPKQNYAVSASGPRT